MTPVDWVALGVVAASALLGFWRGALRELLSLLAWVAAFLLARQYAGAVAALLPGDWARGSLGRPVAFTLLLVGALLVLRVATTAIVALVRLAGLGLPDRVLGLCFGCLRGVLLLLAAAIVLDLTPLAQVSQWRDAAVQPLVEEGAVWLRARLPHIGQVLRGQRGI